MKDFVSQDRWRYIYIEHSWGGLPKLRFEHDKLVPILSYSDDKVPKGGDETYFVIYVRNIRDVINRIVNSDTGAWVFIEPTAQVCGLAAVVIDPNGYMLHLIQMSNDVYLKEDASVKAKAPSKSPSRRSQAGRIMGARKSNAKKAAPGLPPASWGVRMGFMCIPATRAEEMATFYERIFSVVDILDGETSETKAGVGANGMPRKARRKRKGLHIVDEEEFTLALSKFVWLATGPRSQYTSLCFLRRIKRQGAQVTRAVRGSAAHEVVAMITEKKASIFLGYALIVNDLDACIEEMKHNPLHPVDTFVQESTAHVAGLGKFISFRDVEGNEVQLYDVSSLTSDPLKSRRTVVTSRVGMSGVQTNPNLTSPGSVFHRRLERTVPKS